EIGRQGALDQLPEALDYVASLELRGGGLDRVEVCLAEETSVQEARNGFLSGRLLEVIVHAWHGDVEATWATASALVGLGDEWQVGLATVKVGAALLLLELGLGQYGQAVTRIDDNWREDIALAPLMAADAVEAHVRSGTSKLAQ